MVWLLLVETAMAYDFELLFSFPIYEKLLSFLFHLILVNIRKENYQIKAYI